MSTKGKGKVDNAVSVISDNRGEEVLILVIIIIIVKLKKDTLIKVRELAVFTGDRTKFTIYKTSVGLAVWADNKREKSNRIIKIVLE
jgi:hypothetical protein